MLSLSGSNTYTGGTTISAGTLQLAAADALGTGGVTVNGGTLDFGGTSQIGALSGTGGTIIIGGGSTLTVNQGTDPAWDGDFASHGTLVKTCPGVLARNGTQKG